MKMDYFKGPSEKENLPAMDNKSSLSLLYKIGSRHSLQNKASYIGDSTIVTAFIVLLFRCVEDVSVKSSCILNGSLGTQSHSQTELSLE